MPRKKSSKGASVYQLKVTLRDTKPPIWRRILVQGDTALQDLHLIIQSAMGWYNCHLHRFEIDGVRYARLDSGFFDDMEEDTNVRLDRVVDSAGASFGYMYDFGDGWDHTILVEEIHPADPQGRYPQCVGGARACPPEDVGGPWGYEDFLEAIRDPNHEQHADRLEWCGGSFDPEAFDQARTDKAVQHYELLEGEAP